MSPRFEPLPGHGEPPKYGTPAQYHARGHLPTVGAEDHYSHATAPPRNRQEPMSNATRYLCAAAYLDRKFATSVIKNLIGSHRAVAPSRGIDLIPIIRHCLRERKMRLARDAILSILLIFLIFALGSALGFVLNLLVLLSYLPVPHWDRRKLGAKKFTRAIVIRALVLMVALSPLLRSVLMNHPSFKWIGALVPFRDDSSNKAEGVPLSLAFFVLIMGVLFVYSYLRRNTPWASNMQFATRSTYELPQITKN